MTVADRIAGGLEETFAARGFAAPGVDALKEAAGVSLRTLYRHFPSREDMVIGALDHRHAGYLAFLAEGAPEGPGAAPVRHVFDRLADWMRERAPTGCLFVSALAAHPDSAAIREAVARHKAETRALFAGRLGAAAPTLPDARRAALADALFAIHEGHTAAAPSLGAPAAAAAASALVEALLAQEDIR